MSEIPFELQEPEVLEGEDMGLRLWRGADGRLAAMEIPSEVSDLIEEAPRELLADVG